MLKEALDKRPELQKFLFIRRLLVSDKRIESLAGFPFYNNCPELDNLHKYFKNKFHCIWTYSPKTKQNGIYNYSVKDKRKIQSLLDSKNDYLLD